MLELSREQNLQRCSHSLRLQFSPQPTLVASNAVHDSRYVEELLAELKLQFVRVAVEHDAFVKMRWERLDDIQKILHSELNFLVVLVESRVKFFVSQQRRDFGDRSHLDNVSKVKISQVMFTLPAGLFGAEPPLKLLQVWTPNTVRRRKVHRVFLRLQVIRAQVNVDAAVESRHHPVENSFFETGIAQRMTVDER